LKHLNGKIYTLNNINGTVIYPGFNKIIHNMGLQRDEHIGNLIINFIVEFPTTLNEEIINKLKAIL
jgi:DnaJ-class molecular chaperone